MEEPGGTKRPWLESCRCSAVYILGRLGTGYCIVHDGAVERQSECRPLCFRSAAVCHHSGQPASEEKLPRHFGVLLIIALAGTYLLTFGLTLPIGHWNEFIQVGSLLSLAALWGGSTVMGRLMVGKLKYETVTSRASCLPCRS